MRAIVRKFHKELEDLFNLYIITVEKNNAEGKSNKEITRKILKECLALESTMSILFLSNLYNKDKKIFNQFFRETEKTKRNYALLTKLAHRCVPVLFNENIKSVEY